MHFDLRTTGATITKGVAYTNPSLKDIQMMMDWIHPSDTMIFMNGDG